MIHTNAVRGQIQAKLQLQPSSKSTVNELQQEVKLYGMIDYDTNLVTFDFSTIKANEIYKLTDLSFFNEQTGVEISVAENIKNQLIKKPADNKKTTVQAVHVSTLANKLF